MLRTLALCSALVTVAAVSTVTDPEQADGRHLLPVDTVTTSPVYLALVPDWLQAYEPSDGDLDVHEQNVELFGKDAARRYGPDGLTLTRDQPMSDADVKSFVKAISKNGQGLPDDADENAAEDNMVQLADSDAGTSLRLGNVIDMWWYQQNFPTHTRGDANLTSHLETIGGLYSGREDVNWPYEADKCFAKQCPKTKHCFGHWLGSQMKVFNEETASRSARNLRLAQARDLLDDRYGVYLPHTVKDLMLPEIHNDLRKAVETYAKQDPQLLVEPKAEAVVHYRVGDTLDNEPPMHPRSLARALASLTPQPKTIELLNGGFNFGASDHKGLTIKFSVWLLKQLSDEIFKVLPDATVTMPTMASVKRSSVDQDWAKLVNAKSMVCGAGSFGFSAALARDHTVPTTQTRTPAYWHGIFPCTATHYDVDSYYDHGINTGVKDLSTQQPVERHVMHESGRWRLFPYDCMRQEETSVPLAEPPPQDADGVHRQARFRRRFRQR